MKKSKFLSGLSAKLTLAAVALTTAMFTSCSNENIEFDVTPVNAEFVITPVVVAGNVDVTASATISPALNSKGQIVITGTPNITPQTVTITASYNGMSDTKTVNVPTIQAGGFQTEIVKIFLSYTEDGIVATKDESTAVVTEVENLTESKTFENPTAYDKEESFSYIDIEGSKVLSSDYNGNDEAVLALINKFKIDYSEKTRVQAITVPAYSMVTPEVKTVKTVSTYTISTVTRASGLVIATFVVEDYTTTVKGEAISIGHGHDHDHGHGTGNAGGGINDAD